MVIILRLSPPCFNSVSHRPLSAGRTDSVDSHSITSNEMK